MKKYFLMIIISIAITLGLSVIFTYAGTVIFKPGTVLKSGVVIKTDFWLTQKFQTIDDWLNSGGTTNEYTAEESVWASVSGSPFNAGFATSSAPLSYTIDGSNMYLFSGDVIQDTRTGLWWSNVMSIGAVTAVATSTSNIFTLTGVAGVGDGTRPTGGNAILFCDALNTLGFGGHNDWYLPTQKELMQAYIDGSANILPNPGTYFWSSTETYNTTATALSVSLYSGYTTNATKTLQSNVRCVRR